MVTSIKPTLRYQMREYLLSGAVFLGVNIFLILLFSGSFYISVSWGKGVVQYNGYGFASAVFLFVFGIVLPRQALRLGVQMGVSRRTSFLGLLVSSVLASLLLGLAGAVLISGTQALSGGNVAVSDLYVMIYLDQMAFTSAAQHLVSVLFNATLMLCCFAAGLFLTFLFWRLNKLGCVLAGLSIPVLLTGLPSLGYYFREPLTPLLNLLKELVWFFLSSPWAGMLIFLVIAAAFAFLAWRLVRQANIRGAALK